MPILASPFPEIEKVIKQYNIGWVLQNPVTSKNIADIIKKITEKDLKIKKKKCAKFIAHDNWKKYEKRLLDLYKMIDKK